MARLFLRCVFLIVLTTGCRENIPPPEPVYPIPTPAQMRWHEMEQNAFIHFTTTTFTNLEWGLGNESPRIFNPTRMDADQWVSVLKDAGFKGIILTCKHHDGFCLWPSAYTEHSVKNSPYKDGQGDVVRETADACRKHGLQFGVYLSPWDRNHPEYGKPAYLDYYRNQLKELFHQYGPVFEMWFDGANGGTGFYGGRQETRVIDGSRYYEWPATLDLIRSWQPDVIFFSDAGPGVRWCGNEKGIGGETNWNMITPDTLYAGKPGINALLNEGHEQGTHWIPAEVNTSIRPGWFYHPEEDTLVKTPEALFDIYLTSVGRGSTLLLNVPPDTTGKIHPRDIAALRGWKKLRDEAFRKNHAAHAPAGATHHRGNNDRYNAARTTDENAETYWATDDDVLTGSLEITLAGQQPLKYVVLQEYIKLGQRVKSFTVDVRQNDEWETVATGSTIGYKRIIRIPEVVTGAVRINITGAKACPLISEISLY